ncbi:hypothetical protein AUK40_03405 [Candidatus Wirthbacteria bacterium CG2_30_54_11]|uniref:Purine nucleoside phosphorylase n=1 Tax=Candidatus Wirthbacteria bacterium CG2_30_54_11 TaxID=1817892 RepID=A0A1J5ISC7_9BACT|nr:MAG: hypothetical protein AUK40_03405 [Candidatus Wirthbacteria bacterium CG2_30_54_11]
MIHQLQSFLAVGIQCHGFTDRMSGDMRSLEARSAVLDQLGIPAGSFVQAEQVHGASVAVVSSADGSTTVKGVDGLITTSRNLTLAIRVADCVPVLLYDASKSVVGALHAGWRGITGGIIERGLEAFRTLGFASGQLRVGLGPAIGQCCYEVGGEVAELLALRSPGCLTSRSGRDFADLRGAVRYILLEHGVPFSSISSVDVCTSCRQDDLYSWRREHEKAGRIMGFIALP